MSDFASEAELQALIEDAIENERLAQIVLDNAGLLDAAAKEGKGRLPQYSLDRLCRRAAILAGASVLKSLSSLALLRANKNMSMTQNEVLRPDVVCFNSDREKVVLFELKVSNAAGRQAISELAAYEQEIKNYLPLISEDDVHLVLVSSEWSTLMDHSVSSAVTWGGKQILCLEATKVQGELVLKTRIPQAWQITGTAMFPPEALVTMTLCLYDYKSGIDRKEISELDPRLITALEIMGRTGDALGSHGFAILWRDHMVTSAAPYNVTICCVAPFGLYWAGRTSGAITSSEDDFAETLDILVRDTSPSGHSGSFFAIGNSASQLLKELFTPTWEGASFWADDRETLMTRAEPVMCEFWGSLGLHAIDYVSNPAMRAHRQNLLIGNLSDWHDPRVAIPLIDQISGPRMLASGNVRWKDAFQLGFYLGLDRSLRNLIKTYKDDTSLQCRFLWNNMDVNYALDEVQLLSNSAENVTPPKSAFTFQEDPQIDDADDFEQMVKWMVEEFLMGEPGHVNAFICGLEGAPLFDDQGLRLRLDEAALQTLGEGIIVRVRNATKYVLDGLFAQDQEGSLHPGAKPLFEQLKSQLNISAMDLSKNLANVPSDVLLAAWPTSLTASDFVEYGVLHKQHAVDFSNVDWDWLRQGVVEAHQRGDTDVGIILNANGHLGTGNLNRSSFKLMLRKHDPKIEVMFLDETSIFTSIRIMTWSELKALKSYASFGKEKDHDVPS